MKKQGAAMKYSKETVNFAISEYENSNLGWDEIAEKYNVPKAVLQYHRRKRKEEEEKQCHLA